jgi:tRNA pseudouridine55 synthase
VTCSAGFYVRSFAHALGQLAGTGGCLAALRRTRSGEFTLDQAVDLDRVRPSSPAVKERWIALDRLLPRLPAVRLGAEGRRRVAHGQRLGRSHVVAGAEAMPRGSDSWIRLIDEQGQLLALGTTDSTGESLHPAVVLI